MRIWCQTYMVTRFNGIGWNGRKRKKALLHITWNCGVCSLEQWSPHRSFQEWASSLWPSGNSGVQPMYPFWGLCQSCLMLLVLDLVLKKWFGSCCLPYLDHQQTLIDLKQKKKIICICICLCVCVYVCVIHYLQLDLFLVTAQRWGVNSSSSPRKFQPDQS